MQVLQDTNGNTNRLYVTNVTAKGQITLPQEVRALIGIKPKDKVAIRVEKNKIQITQAKNPLEESYSAIPALDKKMNMKGVIAIAKEGHALETASEG